MSQIPIAPAYWISPYNEILPIRDTKHIDDVINYPEKFGYTKGEIEEIYKSFNERIGHEGHAREKIIIDLLQRNWIRIRRYDRPSKYTINVKSLNNRTKDILAAWANAMREQGIKHTDVHIDTPKEIVKSTVDEIASDVLYKEDEKPREVQFIVIKSAEEFGKHVVKLDQYLETVLEQEK